jgi:ribonuclease BN (tRNA processing enzyme)
MVKITFLGTHAAPSKDTETVSFVLDSGEAKILVDTGPGVIRQLDTAGISPTDIDAVIVTHCHGDHTLGFPYFLFKEFFLGRSLRRGLRTIPVISTVPIYKGLMSMFAFTYPPGKYPNIDVVNWNVDENGSIFTLKNIKITCRLVNHVVPTIGVRFDIGSKSIAFSSDTAYDKKMVELAKGCDLLIHEGAATLEQKEFMANVKHAIADEAGRVAKEAGVKALLMTHMFPGESPDALEAEAKKQFGGSVRVAKELEVVEI